MKTSATIPLRAGALLFGLLAFFLMISDAAAQGRARGSTSRGDSSRVEPKRTDRRSPQVEPPARQGRSSDSRGERGEAQRAPEDRRGREGRSDEGRGRTRGEPPARPNEGMIPHREESTAPERTREATPEDRSGTRGRAVDRNRRDDDEGRGRTTGRGRDDDRGRTATSGRDDDRGRPWGGYDDDGGRQGTTRQSQGRWRERPSRIYVPPKTSPHVRHAPSRHLRPHAHIEIVWPWEFRYRRGWAPRYQYRQVVYIESGWGHRRYDSRLDVRTIYRHRVRYATRDKAEVEIRIEGLELYENGRYLGEVRRIPRSLSRIEATIYRNGRVRFDRDVFVVGDRRAGFELVSTRHYGGFVLDAYERSHGYRAGAIDLRRGRVVPVRYSRLFDPYDFGGFVPVSLLPEEAGWLFDYGYDSPSGYHGYDDEDYYYGYRGGDGRYNGGRYDDDRYDDDWYDEDDWSYDRRPSGQVQPDGHASGAVRGAPGAAAQGQRVEPLQRTQEAEFEAAEGEGRIRLKREVELKRID